MALFGKNKNTVKKVSGTSSSQKRDMHGILIKPHFTEKTVALGEKNVYTFDIVRDANATSVREAIKALYNVTPSKVNIVNKKPAKRLKGSTGRKVHVVGSRKAYVYLKKGDSITLV
jgi:large subunit ribosomal protein L23